MNRIMGNDWNADDADWTDLHGFLLGYTDDGAGIKIEDVTDAANMPCT